MDDRSTADSEVADQPVEASGQTAGGIQDSQGGSAFAPVFSEPDALEQSQAAEKPASKGFFSRFKTAASGDDAPGESFSNAQNVETVPKPEKAPKPERAPKPEKAPASLEFSGSEEAAHTGRNAATAGIIAGCIVLVIMMCGDCVMLYQTFIAACEDTLAAIFISAAALAAAVALPWLAGHLIAKRRRDAHARFDTFCLIFTIVAWALLLAGVMAVRYAVEDIPSSSVTVTMIVFLGALLLATAVIACVCACVREESAMQGRE